MIPTHLRDAARCCRAQVTAAALGAFPPLINAQVPRLAELVEVAGGKPIEGIPLEKIVARVRAAAARK